MGTQIPRGSCGSLKNYPRLNQGSWKGTKFWQRDRHTKNKYQGSHILDSRITAGYSNKCSDGKGLRQSWFAVTDSSFYFASQISDLASLYPLSPNKYHVLTCVFLFKEIWTKMDVNALILSSKQKLWGSQEGFSWLFHLCFSRCRDEERGPVALGCVGDSAAVARLLTDVCAVGLLTEA